jgi:hypothetical protein
MVSFFGLLLRKGWGKSEFSCLSSGVCVCVYYVTFWYLSGSNPTLRDSETRGIVGSSHRYILTEAAVDAFTKRDRFAFPTGTPDVLYSGIDPSGGGSGSEYVIETLAYNQGIPVVSRLRAPPAAHTASSSTRSRSRCAAPRPRWGLLRPRRTGRTPRPRRGTGCAPRTSARSPTPPCCP